MAVSKSSPSSRLLAGLQACLEARVRVDDHLCVGLSGGRDSVVLLHLLARLNLGCRLSAIHVHHGLSPRADTWVDFCRDFCAGLDVPLVVERVKVDGESPLGLEAAARQARYRVFAACDAEWLLLAHHRNDQAETLLFNLMRGAGITGAAGMPHERRLGNLRLLRPLLGVSRSDIESYGADNSLAWVEDESNGDTAFSRNFLRHDVLPVLEGRFPAATACLAAAAAHFAEADTLLGELAEADWQACADGDRLSLLALRRLSAIRLKNLLRHRLRCLGWRMPAARRLEEFVRQLLAAGPGARPQLLLSDGEMCVRRGHLHWIPSCPRISL